VTDSSSASGQAFGQLAAFLYGGRLTSVVATLEHALDGSDASSAEAATREAGLQPELLTAALLVRRDLGRLNDLVRAAAIALALPRILEDGERLTNRPSLAAGNDPTRLFDLETERRVAEFKLAVGQARTRCASEGCSTTSCTYLQLPVSAGPSCTSPVHSRCASCAARAAPRSGR